SPVVIGNLAVLGPAEARWGLDRALAERHAAAAARVAEAVAPRWREVFARPAEPAPDVDEDLYGGFVGDEDRRTLNRLRTLSWPQLAERVHAGRVALADGRLEELLFRWRARNAPGTLDDEEAARWQAHRVARLVHGAGGVLTATAFHERVDALYDAAVERGDERAQALLDQLVDHAERIAPEAG
ncbi:MAG: exodeoxyribonuclease I, partial [Betaproteobacteria bacterium]